MLKHLVGLFVFVFCASVFQTEAFAVVNGQQIDLRNHPELGLLTFTANSTLSSRCSGFFINDSQFITAGHCVRDENGDRGVGLLRINENDDLNTVFPTAVFTAFVHEDLIPANAAGPVPGCSIGQKPIVNTKTLDLALINFPAGTSTQWLEIDLDYSPTESDVLDYYGFGTHINPFAMMMPSLAAPIEALRFGQSAIWRWTSTRLALLSPDTKPFAADGDSGAPVIKNGKVVAVMNTVGTKCDTEFGEDYAIQNTATRLTKLTLAPLLKESANKLANKLLDVSAH